MNLLNIQNLTFHYGQKIILDNFQLSLHSKEIVALIGSSGSGKTTLLRLITGLLPYRQGFISIKNQQVPLSYPYVAYMTQEDLLLPWRTVLENILLPAELGPPRSHKDEWHEKALQLIHKVGLKGYEHAYPNNLSGGMRQRVSLARALLLNKPLLLLDEPFGSLDVMTRSHLYKLIHELRESIDLAILLITHDFREAIELADRITLLSNGKISKEWKNISELRHFEHIGSLQEDIYNHLSSCFIENKS